MAPHPLWWVCVPPCASTKIHPTGTWMKPPAHNTDVRSCRRSCLRVRPLNQQQPTQRRTMGYHTPAPAGHPCPQRNPTQQEHGQSPNRKYGHAQPQKSCLIEWNRDKMNTPIPHILGGLSPDQCLSSVETMKGFILEPHWGPMAPHWGIWAQLGPIWADSLILNYQLAPIWHPITIGPT
ncbi:hypothetical protein BS47DRAFT_1358158 [Hydnum rufescens UP504]|uniref:Uncharacterized protein n=1 Tax=Hydnum rufescens UP504 TaxID=1448309 RepID=A0A9P6B8N8_9AGAM|nr:hypothetical protein BS47DRAFT_1358158 [Hydnum rufescens UP504]